MRRLFLTIIVLLVFVSAARANTEIPITQTNLNTLLYSFSVSTNATDSGVAFHVTITHRRFDIYPDSSADVGTIEHAEITNAAPRGFRGPIIQVSFKPLEPAIPIALKKEKRVWTVDFTASRELLRDTNACFVFSVPGGEKSKNKTDPLPADLYELKLHEFVKP
jgi:hypothetical protein